MPPSAAALLSHLRARFPGRPVEVLPPVLGPIHERVSGFHVLRLEPAGGGWLYATSGLAGRGHGLEFVLLAAHRSDVHVETVTMVGHYHATGGEHALDLGHTVAIGRPWLQNSECDHLLVSRPYPWGPELEQCDWAQGHIRVLWLLPITAAEAAFRHEHGLEALEQRFDDAGITPADPKRRSVVPGST
ncbi:suppressor of fused domain protein [Actinoplanes sp. NPDC051470]|uniref:suppressor of fused domain protein n=1 Tax=unclassified Actinoplanes TaxID=2626549 RepID=UPI003425634A